MKYLHQNEESRFNEVLFERRNKEYGAYVLRNESDRILTKSLFVGVSLLAAVSMTPLLINAFKATDSGIQDEWTPPPGMQDVDRPDKQTPVVLPPNTTPAAPVKTIDDRLPEPKAHITNEKVVEKIEGAISGTKNSPEGEIAPPNIHVITTPTIGTGPVINVTPTVPPVVVEKTDKNKIETDLMSEASFSGGIEAFRKKVMNNFDPSGFQSDDVMRTTVSFIVEIDGTISGIKATGADADFNNEAIRTIKATSAKGKWSPGKNKKGEAVRSYFKFPISMKLDN